MQIQKSFNALGVVLLHAKPVTQLVGALSAQSAPRGTSPLTALRAPLNAPGQTRNQMPMADVSAWMASSPTILEHVSPRTPAPRRTPGARAATRPASASRAQTAPRASSRAGDPAPRPAPRAHSRSVLSARAWTDTPSRATRASLPRSGPALAPRWPWCPSSLYSSSWRPLLSRAGSCCGGGGADRGAPRGGRGARTNM